MRSLATRSRICTLISAIISLLLLAYLASRSRAVSPYTRKTAQSGHEQILSPLEASFVNLGASVPSSSLFSRREYTSHGAKHLVLRRIEDPVTTEKVVTTADSTPNVLFLIITNDDKSWGMLNGRKRSLSDFLSIVTKTGHPLQHASLGILTSSLSEYETYASELTTFMSSHSLIAVTLVYQNNFEVGQDAHTGWDRHRTWVQKDRRHLLARVRNYLMLTALDEEDAVFWLDADVFELDDGLLQAMIAADKEVITARCRYGWWPNYDLNAWVGPRKVPSAEELEEIYTKGVRYGADVVKSAGGGFYDKFKQEQQPFRLDSVGATTLYIRADLVRQGVTFPPYYVVGTTWDSEGWDGVESEGLCYVAQKLGYQCWGLPWKWETRHLIN